MHGQLNGLTGTELGDENVRVYGCNGVLAAKVLLLIAVGLEDDVAGVDVGVVVRLEGVRLAGVGVLVDGTCDVELELDGIEVEAVLVGIRAVLGLLVPLEKVAETLTAALEGDQAESVCENFILDDRGVVVDVDILNSQRWDLGEEDTSEGVGEGCVEADEREGG